MPPRRLNGRLSSTPCPPTPRPPAMPSTPAWLSQPYPTHQRHSAARRASVLSAFAGVNVQQNKKSEISACFSYSATFRLLRWDGSTIGGLGRVRPWAGLAVGSFGRGLAFSRTGATEGGDGRGYVGTGATGAMEGSSLGQERLRTGTVLAVGGSGRGRGRPGTGMVGVCERPWARTAKDGASQQGWSPRGAAGSRASPSAWVWVMGVGLLREMREDWQVAGATTGNWCLRTGTRSAMGLAVLWRRLAVCVRRYLRVGWLRVSWRLAGAALAQDQMAVGTDKQRR